MEARIRRRSLCLVLVSTLLAVLLFLGFVLLRQKKDFTKVPLSQCEYLKDVTEPITMLQGMAFSDGGSIGLFFEDSNHIEKAVCLEANLNSEFYLSVHLGTMSPLPGRQVSIGGLEERALLGLLQRWARNDPEARNWSETRKNPLTAQSPPEQHAKTYAIALMKLLLKRN